MCGWDSSIDVADLEDNFLRTFTRRSSIFQHSSILAFWHSSPKASIPAFQHSKLYLYLYCTVMQLSDSSIAIPLLTIYQLQYYNVNTMLSESQQEAKRDSRIINENLLIIPRGTWLWWQIERRVGITGNHHYIIIYKYWFSTLPTETIQKHIY